MKKQRRRLNQNLITRLLREAIRGNPWKPQLKVRYDRTGSDPELPGAEHCGLFAGPKLRGQGRATQRAQVDVLAEDGRCVDLIVEIDSFLTANMVRRIVAKIASADNFTPSRLYGMQNARKIENCLLVIGFLGDSSGRWKIDPPVGSGIREIQLCVGQTESEVLQQCLNAIGEFFTQEQNRC